ncbi:MAG: TonB family protein [Vicinamibacterales bacterium]
MSKSLAVALCLIGVGVSAQSRAPSPAHYQSGGVPALPALAVAGGEVMLEVDVAADGRVASVTPLRVTPPFTDAVVNAVRGWRFQPAEQDAPLRPGQTGKPPRVPVPSKVLVAAVFRAPALTGPTLGQLPAEVRAASAEVAFPLATTIPSFPPNARGSGVVLLEGKVDGAGAVTSSRVIRSAAAFDDPARQALQQWRFRPARRAANVYVIFGFPEPIVQR